jgi:polysaccharide export outer membrane protein
MKDLHLRAGLPWMAAALVTTLAIGILWGVRDTPRGLRLDTAASRALQPHPRPTGSVVPLPPIQSDWGIVDALQPGDRPVRRTVPQPDRQAPRTIASPALKNQGTAAPEEDSSLLQSLPAVEQRSCKPAAAQPAPATLLSASDAGPSTASQRLHRALPAALGRSQALELAAREADLHTQRAFELASQRAHFASRAQFIRALRVAAQALDTEKQTADHSRALAAGLTAIREAEDFLPSGSRLEADLDMPGIIAGHRTPVLKNAPARSVTPQIALQSYFTFAQTQLGIAAGEELAASMACHGLGKLHAAVASQQAETIRAAWPKSMVFFQAALLVNPRNYMASNELGSLLARASRYEDARTALEHSVSIQSSPAAWHNLAVVYHGLGQANLAQQASWFADAASREELARSGQSGRIGRAVQWVDADRFVETYRPPAVAPRPSGPPSQAGRLSADTAPPEGLEIQLCQALAPAVPYGFPGTDGSVYRWRPQNAWEADRASFWQGYAQGEYVAHARTAHVFEYRLRPDDQLDMIFRVTREETSQPYKLNVGDEIRVESLTDANLNRELVLQPDGTITVRLLGQVRATGKTVTQLRDDLEKAFLKYYKVPAISVTPLKMNTKLEDLRATVDRRQGIGGQSQLVRITPEGSISLPAIGCVPAQGLTLQELQQELNERYREQIEGMEVIPVLVQRAPRYVYVLGEVRNPGRFELVGPTTVIQAVSLAGGWNAGSNLRQVVVFRRDDAWRLLATMVNLQAALYGRQPCPPGEIWLSDSDVVIVPKGKILIADEFIDLVFTRGIYGVFPLTSSLNFSKLSTL